MVQVLRQVAAARALPKRVWVDNGTEFTSKALDHWAYWNGVALDFSRPAKPVDNTFIEAFNGTLRRECLSLHWFLGLEDLQLRIFARLVDSNWGGAPIAADQFDRLITFGVTALI